MRKTILILGAPDRITSVDQISDEHQFFLGAFGEVIGMLRQIFPEADFSDPTEITVNRGENSIRIEINKHTPVQNFTINTEGELPLIEVMKLCKRTGWRALDTDTGLFLDKTAAKGNITEKVWWRFWR